jgi:hypothetical protein
MARQFRDRRAPCVLLDCFVAPLLAMTIPPERAALVVQIKRLVPADSARSDSWNRRRAEGLRNPIQCRNRREPDIGDRGEVRRKVISEPYVPHPVGHVDDQQLHVDDQWLFETARTADSTANPVRSVALLFPDRHRAQRNTICS